MNKEILIDVIERSLVIEDMLSQILKTLLEIENVESKTLSHKTSALSFMSKVDLLYDIERINIDSYNLLRMFGEIRNQFMHNKDADTFSVVLERINKKSSLLKINADITNYFKNAVELDEKERIYELAFHKLSIDIKTILEDTHKQIFKEKIDNAKKALKALEKENLERFMKLLYKSIEEFSDSFSQKMKETTGIEFGDYISEGIIAILVEKLKENK